MKYSLMTHMIDKEIKLKKPTFIHILIMKDMGYTGEDPTLEEAFDFLRAHGMPVENGTMTFRDLVRFAKENGFDGIDVMSHHFEEDPAEAKAALEEYGITLSAINIIEPFCESADEAEFAAHLENAKAIIDRGAAAGCKNFLVMPAGYTPAEGKTLEEIYQLMVRGLKACVEYGKTKGVIINTETLESACMPLCSIGNMTRLFQDVPDLRYSHDTGNPLVALENPVAAYETFRDRVAAVHFKDMEFKDHETQSRDLLGRYMDKARYGDGLVDFPAHLRVLKKDNYQGFITVEGWISEESQLEGAVSALQYFREMEQNL